MMLRYDRYFDRISTVFSLSTPDNLYWRGSECNSITRRIFPQLHSLIPCMWQLMNFFATEFQSLRVI